MTITYSHLSGEYENTDKVIAWNIGNMWDESNTDTIVPTIENGTDEPDYNAQFNSIGPNAILINTVETDISNITDEVNSDTVHSIYESIVITIVAESRDMRIKIENEVNRILWELNINSSNRIKKSDGVSNSHIDRFEKSEVSFLQISLDNTNIQDHQGSVGILTVIYYKFRS